jgi:hypothetical protein
LEAAPAQNRQFWKPPRRRPGAKSTILEAAPAHFEIRPGAKIKF